MLCVVVADDVVGRGVNDFADDKQYNCMQSVTAVL